MSNHHQPLYNLILASVKHTKSYRTWPQKSWIYPLKMVMFHSDVNVYLGVYRITDMISLRASIYKYLLIKLHALTKYSAELVQRTPWHDPWLPRSPWIPEPHRRCSPPTGGRPSALFQRLGSGKLDANRLGELGYIGIYVGIIGFNQENQWGRFNGGLYHQHVVVKVSNTEVTQCCTQLYTITMVVKSTCWVYSHVRQLLGFQPVVRSPQMPQALHFCIFSPFTSRVRCFFLAFSQLQTRLANQAYEIL